MFPPLPPLFQSPSLRGSGRFETSYTGFWIILWSFNPLHCGAVVASRLFVDYYLSRRFVSIPFIAGQWSLRRPLVFHERRNRQVSIPFIAGQWSLPFELGVSVGVSCFVSIPFIAGQWSLRLVDAFVKGCGVYVSIPFIAGQWSLPFIKGSGIYLFAKFQSPSLRGSGRFTMWSLF